MKFFLKFLFFGLVTLLLWGIVLAGYAIESVLDLILELSKEWK